MKLDTTKAHKNVLVVLNDRLTRVDLAPSRYGFSVTENGRTVVDDLADYDAQLDAYNHMSGDGNQFYTVMRILNEDDRAQSVPDLASVEAKAKENFGPVIDAVMQGEMDPSDLIFALNVLKSPTFIHQAWQQTGDIDAAHKKLLKNIFNI